MSHGRWRRPPPPARPARRGRPGGGRGRSSRPPSARTSTARSRPRPSASRRSGTRRGPPRTARRPTGGPRPERPDRAYLDRGAAERRSEVLARRDRDPLARAPGEQLEEPVAADLVAEPRAPRAQDAALAVEPDQRRHRDRLREHALRVDEAALARPERERLILQRALSAAVADRAVERVVQQQEL